MQYETVVFDIGNVLVEWDPRCLYGRMFGGRMAAMDWFLANVCTPAWNLEQDRGRSWSAAVAALRASHPEWREEIEAFDRRWHETLPGALEDSVAIFRRLKQGGVPLYAVTNFSAEKFDECRARFSFLSEFDGIVVSAAEKLVKPDPAIFQVLFTRFGLDPARCIFIDDAPKNVAAAQAQGMTGLAFTGAAKLAADLRALGFDV